MRPSGPLLLLLWVACQGKDEPAREETGLVVHAIVTDWSRTVRPGGALYLTSVEGLAEGFVVEVGGARISDVPRFVAPNGGFAVYDLPDGLGIGPTELAVRSGGAVQSLPIEVVDPVFADVSDAVGLVHDHDVTGWPGACAEALSGVGFGDLDLDGDVDAIVGNVGAGTVVWRNDGDGDGLPRFIDASAGSGLEHLDLVSAVNLADYDDDGDPDVFLGRRGNNRLLRNRVVPDGVAAFEDVTAASGLPTDLEQRTMGAAWGDYDGDADLDLYVVTHAWCFPDDDPTSDHRPEDHLYRNDDGVFVEVTEVLPDLYGEVSDRFGFTAIWVDYDRDVDQDLVVFNDHVAGGGSGVLFRNDGPTDGGWAFTNISQVATFSRGPDALGKGINAMGGAVADVNGDGHPDFAFSNIGPNRLELSSVVGGQVVYTDVGAVAGIQRTEQPWFDVSVTWGTHLFDWDNDGDVDVMYVGGDLKGVEPQPHAFFDNEGDGTFTDLTWQVGLESPRQGKGSALVDLDEDGFLDVVVANWADRLEVYRNTSGDRGNANHWLTIDLVGDGVEVSRDAFGAIVELETADGVRTCFRNPMPSLSGTGDPGCHFGLGSRDRVDRITVVWPDGVTVDVPPPEGVDRRLEVVRGE